MYRIHFAEKDTSGKMVNATTSHSAITKNRLYLAGDIISQEDVQEIFDDYDQRFTLLFFTATNECTGEFLKLK